jgi:hypothetical protein
MKNFILKLYFEPLRKATNFIWGHKEISALRPRWIEPHVDVYIYGRWLVSITIIIRDEVVWKGSRDLRDYGAGFAGNTRNCACSPKKSGFTLLLLLAAALRTATTAHSLTIADSENTLVNHMVYHYFATIYLYILIYVPCTLL